MADTKASALTFAVSADGVTYTDVAGVKDASMSNARGVIDVNDFDEPGWNQSLIDRGDLTVSGSYNYDEADAGQTIMRTASQTGAFCWFRYRPGGDGSGTLRETFAKAIIESHDDANADGSAIESSFSMKSTGAPTFQMQP